MKKFLSLIAFTLLITVSYAQTLSINKYTKAVRVSNVWYVQVDSSGSGNWVTLSTNNYVNNLIATREAAFAKNTAFNKNFGSTAGTVSEGNHTHSGFQTLANLSTTTTLGTSNTLYPSQNAVKAYVDNAVTASSGYNDEMAQDAIGAMINSEFTYTDATPQLSINAIAQSKITGLVAALGAKADTNSTTLTIQAPLRMIDAVTIGIDSATATQSGYLSITNFIKLKEAYDKYTSSGTYSAGTITFTRRDGTTYTVTGISAGGGVANFRDLSDVNVTTRSNGQVPMYNSTSQKWENQTVSMVDLTGIAVGDILKYDGTKFVKLTLPASSLSGSYNDLLNKPTLVTSFSALTDVSLSGLANNQVAVYKTATSKWTNTDMSTMTLTSPVNGQQLEYQSGEWVNITTRIKGSGTLDFPSTAAATSSDLTITVTGAALGDQVLVTKTTGTRVSGEMYAAFVSATNTVTVRLQNVSSAAIDIVSTTYNVTVLK